MSIGPSLPTILNTPSPNWIARLKELFAKLFAHAPGKHVISPTTDLLCVGLGSIFILAPLVLFGDQTILSPGASIIALLTLFVNSPHFMASYRILYRTRKSILNHPWASMIVPAGLFAYLAYAIMVAEKDISHLSFANLVSALYLAWHYTGQVWGMMATYAHLAGKPFSKMERILIRTGLRLQLAWHFSWVLHYDGGQSPVSWPLINNIYFAMSCLTVVAFVLALIAFASYRRRTGQLPPLNACVAWLALCFWYGAMARHPETLFWVQIAHAVQYLSFPIRLEMNQYEREHPQNHSGAMLRSMVYFAALIAVGKAVEWSSKYIGVDLVGDFFGVVSGSKFPIAVLAFVNIHHFFIDGCIWKISNKEVSTELFAHLKRQ